MRDQTQESTPQGRGAAVVEDLKTKITSGDPALRARLIEQALAATYGEQWNALFEKHSETVRIDQEALAAYRELKSLKEQFGL